MKKLLLALPLAVMAQAGAAATLDFSGNICGGPCFNAAAIDQSYGDIAGELDIKWDANTGTTELENVLHWSGSYEDLDNVAYALDSGSGMSITFEAANGFDVTLDGFSIARYADRVVSTSLKLIDLADGSVLLDTGAFSTTVNSSISYIIGAQSSAGFELLFGPDAWNVGISNISYTTSQTPSVSAVPLPAAGWMLIAALGGLSMVRRRSA